MVEENRTASSKVWLTLLALSSTVTPLATAGQLQATASPNLLNQMAVFEDDLLGPFAQLKVGMTTAEVRAAMKHRPHRMENSVHFGLQIERLAWRHRTSGSTYVVVLVGGRLVSKHHEQKPLFD